MKEKLGIKNELDGIAFQKMEVTLLMGIPMTEDSGSIVDGE